jgi:uncharacterized protein (TIGR02594 family)
MRRFEEAALPRGDLMPRLSISYRRSDSEAITGRIFDRLISHYGRKSVFRDVDNVPVGVDFRSHIQDVLQKSDILLAVVGPNWRGPRSNSPARIEEDNDQVRIELETALKKGIPVIPVLVGRSEIPAPSDLPDSLKPFSYRNAVRIDPGQDFDHHVDRLIRETDSILKGKKPRLRPFAVAGIAAAVLLALALAGVAYWWLSKEGSSSTPWLGVAQAEKGEEEIAGPENNSRILEYIASVQSTRGVQDDETDWASSFAEWSLNQVGIEGPQSMDPNAWLAWGRGIELPEEGCIAVFSFSGLPHVGFYVGEEGKSVNVLGGNQSDVVKVSRYAKKDVVGYRLPAQASAPQP